MADFPEVKWPGKSGATYNYFVCPIGTRFYAKPGNYIFARIDEKANKWVPIYIGETGDLSTRFDNHHQQDAIAKEGATHIHAHLTSGDEQSRRDEETDLRHLWNPVCNEQ